MRRAVAWMLLLLALAALIAPGLAAEPPANTPKGPKGLDLPPYALRFARLDSHSHNATVWRGGELVYEMQHFFTRPQVLVRRNFPRQGVTTAFFAAYTGGAHCCTFLLLFTKTPNATHFQLAELAHSHYSLERVAGQRVIAFRDTAFAYYAPAENLFLCYACSPFPERLLVLGENGWEIDQPGRFAAYYAARLQAIKRRFKPTGKDQDAAAAIHMAYLLRMTGAGLEEVQAELAARLPDAWLAAADNILMDIAAQTEDYTPLTDMAAHPERAGQLTDEAAQVPARATLRLLQKYQHLLQSPAPRQDKN